MINLTKYIQSLSGKKIAVLGLGVSNRAAVRALIKAGADVVAWDDLAQNCEGLDATIRNLMDENFETDYEFLVAAPGIPLTLPAPHPIVEKANKAGLEIICDLELLHRASHGRKTIGITGTNGKSTTTALIGHILNECGITAKVGGNIGKAALDLVMPPKDGVFVLEMSSFQLDLCPTFAPDIGILLNLSPDHLDRHGTMDAYGAAKARIFRGEGVGIISVDDNHSEKIYEQLKDLGHRTIYPLSVNNEDKDGVFVKNGVLFEAMYGDPVEISEMDIATLPGVHNHQNAADAYAAARSIGLEPQAIMAAMKTFPGLQHRQFLSRTINGVAYVNDSKATNANAAARALVSYRNVYWIAGGRPKDGGLKGIEPYMDHVRHVFLIGEAMDEFASWLDKYGVPHEFSRTLERAVDSAHRIAQSERGQPGGTGTVVLSPACASFDQFKSFEERGDEFNAIVAKLSEDDL